MALFKGELPNGKSRVVGHNRATQPSLLYDKYDEPQLIETANEKEAETVEADLALAKVRTAEVGLTDSRKDISDQRGQPKEPIFGCLSGLVGMSSKFLGRLQASPFILLTSSSSL